MGSDSSGIHISASGPGSSINAIFHSPSASIVETDMSANTDLIAAAVTEATLDASNSAASAAASLAAMNTPFVHVANGRQMAPLKCPIVASNGSGTNMFKTGTCYPVINTSSDYSNFLAGIKSLLMGNGFDTSAQILASKSTYKTFMDIDKFSQKNIGLSGEINSDEIINRFDSFYDFAFDSACTCYSGPCYCCCLPSINCSFLSSYCGAIAAYYNGGIGDASGYSDTFNSFFIINADANYVGQRMNISGILIDSKNGLKGVYSGFFPTLDFSAGITVEPGVETIQQGYIKLVEAICDNEFKVDVNGMPRYYLPANPVNIQERVRSGKLKGKYEDYAVLQNFTERCTGSSWCTPNDAFLDWGGCVYPMDSSMGGTTRTVEDVSKSTLPQLVSVKSILKSFDNVCYLLEACMTASIFCYWKHKSGTGRDAIYELSPVKPAQNLQIHNLGLDMSVNITGPDLLQDQPGVGENLTRLPGIYYDMASPRLCCEGKMWIFAGTSRDVTAYLRNICGMQNSVYENKQLDIPIADVGFVKDMCGNPTNLGPQLVGYGLFAQGGGSLANIFYYNGQSNWMPMEGVANGLYPDFVAEVNLVQELYNKTKKDTFNKIQGHNVYDLMKAEKAQILNHVNLLENGISYDPVPSTFVYNPAARTTGV